MRRMLILLALALAVPAAAADRPVEDVVQMPGWIAGAWIQQEGQSWSDEFWTPPRGGLMIGAARMGRDERIDMFEHTRILRGPDGKLVFYAQPFGAAAASFPMVASGPQMIEFASSQHDYPQRIRYWREGPLLRARISLLDGSRAAEWTYRPMGATAGSAQ